MKVKIKRPEAMMQQGQIVEVEITDLSDSGGSGAVGGASNICA